MIIYVLEKLFIYNITRTNIPIIVDITQIPIINGNTKPIKRLQLNKCLSSVFIAYYIS